eukprot:3405739-Amphidinium_carterae.3
MKDDVFGDAMKVLKDIFANTATARLRLMSEDLADNTLPGDEQMLYNYVCFLRVDKAAKSIAKSFVESLATQ